MLAFCTSPLHLIRPSFGRAVTSTPSLRSLSAPRTVVTVPYAKVSKTKSSRNKRPRPERNSSGFASSSPRDPSSSSPVSASSSSPPLSSPSSSDEPLLDKNGNSIDEKQLRKQQRQQQQQQQKQQELQRADANGITMEHRLREEIIHPLRKPKLTLFVTLTASATLGFFFACGRLAADKDAPGLAATNLAIDLAAISIFAYLAWREVEFGRRAVNSIARCPQPRDLPVMLLTASDSPVSNIFSRNPFSRFSPSSTASPTSDTASRPLSGLIAQTDIVIVAGRSNDVRKYLDRCEALASYATDDPLSTYSTTHPVLVALATDTRDSTGTVLSGATAAAPLAAEKAADWVAWLGDAVPPRRNVALFRIDSKDTARESANAYVVAIDDPTIMPLPGDAKRLTVVEV